MPIADILLSLIIILVSAKVLGDLAERIVQPGVFSALVSTVVLTTFLAPPLLSVVFKKG